MKLKPEFITHSAGEESMLVSTGGTEVSGLVRRHRTLGVILELLKTDTTEAELTAELRRRFDAPEGVVEADVKRALAELRNIGALNG